jgi:glycosyltransferase involved in cell wall biosynthesis
VEVAGKDLNKGADIVSQLVSKGGYAIEPLGFGGRKEERWRLFDMAVLPSRHEGGPYAQLEAMATGKKIIASRSGYFKHDVSDSLFWGTHDIYWRTFADMIDEAVRAERSDARKWVEENATIEIFNESWRACLQPPSHISG